MVNINKTVYKDERPSWRSRQNDAEVRFVLDQHFLLDFYSAISLKQQRSQKCLPSRTQYPDSEPTNHCWWDHIGVVMVSVLASSAVDHGFAPRSDQTKNYKIGICCFSTKQATQRRKKQWFVGSESGYWVREGRHFWLRLLFQWDSFSVLCFLLYIRLCLLRELTVSDTNYCTNTLCM
jgi:hypothetical protein